MYTYIIIVYYIISHYTIIYIYIYVIHIHLKEVGPRMRWRLRVADGSRTSYEEDSRRNGSDDTKRAFATIECPKLHSIFELWWFCCFEDALLVQHSITNWWFCSFEDVLPRRDAKRAIGRTVGRHVGWVARNTTSMYAYTYVYIYIYIHMQRERERERDIHMIYNNL